MSAPAYSYTIDDKPVWVFDDLCSLEEATGIFKGLSKT
jgi:hypothetical protein